ncbi:hypothetical protein MAJ_09162, partial [Metarhizium majus ARSEF 297]
MNGNYVAVSGPPLGGFEEHSDMTPVDFRHTLDFFSTYFDDTIRATPTSRSLRVLKISSPLEHILYGLETFTPAWVARDYTSTSDISDLAVVLLGYDIRVCQVRDSELERQSDVAAEGSNWDNPYTRVLMVDIHPSANSWGGVKNWHTKGSAILLREDRHDLDTELMEMMCRYCVEVLQPLFERCLKGEVSRSIVQMEMSQEKMSAWIKRQEGQSGREDGKVKEYPPGIDQSTAL